MDGLMLMKSFRKIDMGGHCTFCLNKVSNASSQARAGSIEDFKIFQDLWPYLQIKLQDEFRSEDIERGYLFKTSNGSFSSVPPMCESCKARLFGLKKVLQELGEIKWKLNQKARKVLEIIKKSCILQHDMGLADFEKTILECKAAMDCINETLKFICSFRGLTQDSLYSKPVSVFVEGAHTNNPWVVIDLRTYDNASYANVLESVKIKSDSEFNGDANGDEGGALANVEEECKGNVQLKELCGKSSTSVSRNDTSLYETNPKRRKLSSENT